MLHRVLPCNAERFMLTIWIDSPDVNPPEESTLRITRPQLEDWCVAARATYVYYSPTFEDGTCNGRIAQFRRMSSQGGTGKLVAVWIR